MKTVQPSPFTPPDAPPVSPPARSALALIFSIIFLDILGLTILGPVLPYIVRQYSTEALSITLMTVIFSAAQFLAAPLLGHLSDRYGRRPVLLLSILGSAIGYALFGIGGALWVLFLSRLIEGFTGGNISTAIAYIADITPPQARSKNFGLVGLAFGLGFTVGPALGGLLSQISLAAPAFLAGGLSLLSALAGFFMLPESLPPSHRLTAPLTKADLNPLVMIVDLFRHPTVRVFLGVQCAFLLAFAGVNSILPVFLIERFQAQPTQLAGLFGIAGLTTAIVNGIVVGILAPRYGEEQLTLVGLVLQGVCCLGYLAMTIAPFFWLAYLISGLSGGSSALIFAVLGALISNHVSEREQGRTAGVNAALMSLMNALGPLGTGVAYDHIAPVAPFWGGVVCLGLAILLLIYRLGKSQ